MKPTLWWIIRISPIPILAGVLALSLVVVDETEFSVVTSFGRIVSVYGDEPSESGLHLKAPWQMALKIDRRLKVFDPPPREVITGDKRNLEIAPYVVWRVSEPISFLRGSVSSELAEARLNERVSAGLSDAIGRRELAALASTDRGKWALDEVTQEVLNAISPGARSELGVEVLDVRLRRFTHPIEVRPAVFDLIRSERRQVADKLRAEGEAEYVTITSQADRMRDSILARAEAEARRIQGNAEAEATRLLNEAHARDPRFFEFLHTLEAYRSILDNKTTLVLSASSPLLGLLVKGPPHEPVPDQAPARAANAPADPPDTPRAARQP
jgi:membrane protease subunit HflC